ncbi:MAG: tetratricopeptide repeat protein [Candidatus Kapabacteria bacterium]|nr:tetratricopeptide repeat protein [Ignavibacteriota bacterium]MCW5884326.1 tetratricopeptide repeat protein [Candidatus Kapabacteria bacterium]
MKIQNVLLILVAFLVSISFESNAQWVIMRHDADSLVREGTNHIYNVEFDKAEICFKKIINIYPEHPAGYFLDAMVYWWKITLHRETKKFDQPFEDRIQKVINICDKILDTNEFDLTALFFKAGAMGYRGRHFAQRESWVKSASDGAAAYNLMVRCQKLAPANHDIMLGTGIYNYFAIAIPEKFPMVKPLMTFFPRGDKQLGIYQLRAASRKARYAAVEARVVLLQIYNTFEKEYDLAGSIAKELFETYNNNPYFHRYYSRILVRKGSQEEYEAEWRKVLIRCMDKYVGYDNFTAREAMYYIGLSLMRKGDRESALRYFLKANEGKIIDTEDSGFTVNVNIYLGNLYDLKGMREEAKKYYNAVLNMKNFDNSHTKANVYLQKPYGSR